MASPLLRFVFLLACVVDVATATEEAATPQAEAINDHEDVEAILRDLQAEPAPDMVTTSGAVSGNTTTSAAVTGDTKVAGAISITVDNPDVILGNATVKRQFEKAMETTIATNAKVSANAVTVTASKGSRRLESAEPRQLAGTIRIDYTITTTSDQSNTVIANVKTLTDDVAKLKKATQDAIQGIDSAICPLCANTTVTSAVATTAPAVTNDTDTSSADRSHVLWAIFSFAATWVL